jgi:hypothetical protein
LYNAPGWADPGHLLKNNQAGVFDREGDSGPDHKKAGACFCMAKMKGVLILLG